MRRARRHLALRIISARPVTETSAESLRLSCQTLPRPGRAKRSTCGAMMRRKRNSRAMPTARAASISPRRDREKGAAIDFRLIGARNDADAERAGEKRRQAEKAAKRRTGAPSFGDQSRAAEIEEIDHQQFRHAAKHRRIGVADDARARRFFESFAQATSAPKRGADGSAAT